MCGVELTATVEDTVPFMPQNGHRVVTPDHPVKGVADAEGWLCPQSGLYGMPHAIRRIA